MKSLSLKSYCFVVCLAAVGGLRESQAEVLACDSFDYSPGLLESREALGGFGWDGAWENVPTLTIADDGASLAYPPGISSKPQGSRLLREGASLITRKLDGNVSSVLHSEGGKIYLSAIVRKEKFGETNDYATVSLISPGPARKILTFGITSLEQIRIALFDSQGVTSADFDASEPILLVVGLERKENSLIAKLWIFDAGSGVPSSEPDPIFEENESVPFEWNALRIAIESGESTIAEIDEIRVLTDWASVVNDK